MQCKDSQEKNLNTFQKVFKCIHNSHEALTFVQKNWKAKDLKFVSLSFYKWKTVKQSFCISIEVFKSKILFMIQ